MAHDPGAYSKLGRVVAHAKGRARRELAAEYERVFMEALGKIATVRKHCNVLHHILGYFKKLLGGEERKELLEVIEDFRGELIPLVVPITLFRHHVRKYNVTYLGDQSYLQPHPRELMLRNHV